MGWAIVRYGRDGSGAYLSQMFVYVTDVRPSIGMPVAPIPYMTDIVHERVRGEYREMPGLHLTVAQAARLFNLEPAQCGQVLDTLVTIGELWTNGREYFGSGQGRRFA